MSIYMKYRVTTLQLCGDSLATSCELLSNKHSDIWRENVYEANVSFVTNVKKTGQVRLYFVTSDDSESI